MKNKIILAAAVIFAATSCNRSINVTDRIDEDPVIFPDYADVTIPQEIAPLDFRLNDEKQWDAKAVRLTCGEKEILVKGEEFIIPQKEWKELTSQLQDISVEVLVKKDGKWASMNPFTIHVSPDAIDSHIAYRLIDPGYETWNRMGIYERSLKDFTQKAIVTNEQSDRNCMNCHSFCNRDPEKMVFHMRWKNGGTYVLNGKSLEKLNTKTPETLSAVVYPQWHPSGKYIAFSVNDIAQVFHSTNPNRIEVYDAASDIVIYDVAKHEVLSVPELMDSTILETYPSFSPDGKTLYFCSSPQQIVPQDYKDIRYSICSIAFDPETCSFGKEIDTVYNAHSTGLCATFPRVSPDGRFLLYTETAYGCFSIWHKDADLRLHDLTNGKDRSLEAANSPDVESYHSWSSNGRWIIFSSRRIDGLYTRPFIAHIDSDGNVSKPFVLPQESTHYYEESLKSFNIPEFITGEVPESEAEFIDKAKNDKGIDLTFREAGSF